MNTILYTVYKVYYSAYIKFSNFVNSKQSNCYRRAFLKIKKKNKIEI